jgi:hypothetical protein
MTSAAVCAACGLPAQAGPAGPHGPRRWNDEPGDRGCLVLYETRGEDGALGSAWFHSACVPALSPVQTLPDALRRPDVFGEMQARHVRKRVWAAARARRAATDTSE